jgi:hypothetical protein
MTRKTVAFLALAAALAAARAADTPEAVYARLHAAALARNLDEMRLYAAEAQRAELIVPELPRTYSVTGKAARRDGKAVELRASGTADTVGLGFTQMFGVIGLVKEKGEWKVERLSWSTQRPGEYPEGYVIVQGPAPEPRSSGEPQTPRFAVPPSAPEPSHLLTRKPAEDPKPQDERKPGTEPAPCVIKPVMSDADLRACGSTPADSR